MMGGKGFLALAGLLMLVWPTSVDAQEFSVARTTDLRGDSIQQVGFDKVITNVADGFDEDTNSFTTPVSGTYYFSLSAGLEAGMGSRLNLIRDAQQGIEVRNEDSNTNGHGISSRGLFSYVSQGTQFTIAAQLDETHSIQGDTFTHQTQWNAFRYEDVAETFVAFSVAMSQNQTISANPMIYDTEIFNQGPDGPPFDMDTGIFTCEDPGIYFFHISAGARAEREVRLNITRNFPDEQIGSLIRTDRAHNGVDTFSRTLLVSLDDGDEVHVLNDLGSETYSDGGYQTSFSGFLYTLATGPGGDGAIAFMAYRTENWDSPISESPILFDEVTVQRTLGFNQSTSVFTVGIPGTYFFSLSAGSVPGKQVSVSQRDNGQVVMQLENRSNTHNGIGTISRDLVHDCEFGDILFIAADGGTALYSDVGMQTSWMAFRIRTAEPK